MILSPPLECIAAQNGAGFPGLVRSSPPCRTAPNPTLQGKKIEIRQDKSKPAHQLKTKRPAFAVKKHMMEKNSRLVNLVQRQLKTPRYVLILSRFVLKNVFPGAQSETSIIDIPVNGLNINSAVNMMDHVNANPRNVNKSRMNGSQVTKMIVDDACYSHDPYHWCITAHKLRSAPLTESQM